MKRSHEPIDPTEFSPTLEPSVLQLTNGELQYVANHTTSKSGRWIVCRCWDGSMVRYAHHSVSHIRDVAYFESVVPNRHRCLVDEGLVSDIQMSIVEANATFKKAEKEAEVSTHA